MKRHVAAPVGVLVALALMLICILPACTGVAVPTYQTQDSSLNPAQYVNPFIGTSPFSDARSGFSFDSGDVTPAATYPMGMVLWGPDTTTSIPGHYYYPDTAIKSFSLTHFSGRGCSAWGDFPFMPYVGAFASLSSFSHSNESAHPGYYQVRLDGPNVNVELAAAAHSGMGQFTYPSSTHSSMLINAGGSVNGNSNASVSINTSDNEVTGQATSTVGCGSEHYTLYFAAQFDHPFTHARGNGTSAANLTFDTTPNQVVHVKVGISFVSVANARQNRDREIGSSNFTAVRNAANATWNARLNTIQVQGGTEDEKVIFYTALYHCFFHPNVFSDVNGQYLGFDGKIHTVARGHAQYENIPGWDNYRSLIRLRAIIAPNETSDIAQSLVNDAQQGDGHLPRWEQANVDSHGMNGDSGDIEVAEAYVFGDTNFDAPGALMAMVNGQPKVREGYNDYVNLGYVANGTAGNSVVITQEYTNDDFAIAQFAQALGNTADYNTFMQRSNNWTNVLNTTSGYVQPRNSDGSWAANFSSTSEHGFQETDSAQSTWMESFNLRGLFDALGGNSVVVGRLDTFFTRLNDGSTSQYAFMGNEPSEEIPWEYDFAGAPSHTQEVVRRIETQLFTNTPGGLPGNDDAGSLSSWYVFAAIGLYPEIPGVGGFVTGSPLFTAVTIHLAGGHTLQINAPAASDENPYVQSLNLNGQPTTSLWLPWSTVKNGATLDFILGSSATSWGSSASDAPPSFP